MTRALMKITILEFTPCADSILHLGRDPREGYAEGDGREVVIRSGAKLRPRMVSTYAGGKATNVARVMDRLLGEGDAAEIELIVFRPDNPEGRYIHDLQTCALSRVIVRPVIIEGRSRLCIDLTDPATDPASRVEFNISPRALWPARSLDVALEFASGLESDLLLMAGNPPVIEETGEMAAELYSRVLERVRGRVARVSLDTEKGALASCLAGRAQPDVIKINGEEYGSVDASLWGRFEGALVVTDAGGCRLWPEGMRSEPLPIKGFKVPTLYSTIGAGDAVHAGFTLARWVRGLASDAAARYGLAAAAASVSSPNGTRGVTRGAVEAMFREPG